MSNTNNGVQGNVVVNNIVIDMARYRNDYFEHREKLDSNLKVLKWTLDRCEKRFKVIKIRNDYPVPLAPLKHLTDYFLNINSYLKAIGDQLGGEGEEALQIEVTGLSWLTAVLFVEDLTFLNDLLKSRSAYASKVIAWLLGVEKELGSFKDNSAREFFKQLNLFVPVKVISPVKIQNFDSPMK